MKNGTIPLIFKHLRKTKNVKTYLTLFFFPILIISISILIGLGNTINEYHGYFDVDNLNWVSFPIVLPLSYYLLRYVLRKIIPVPVTDSPILCSISDPDDRAALANSLSAKILCKKTVSLALGITIIVNAIDFWDKPGKYYWMYFIKNNDISSIYDISTDIEKDWSVYFLLKDADKIISPETNFTFSLLAYSQQFIASLFGFLILVIFFFHNITFLKLIYQRRRDGHNNPNKLIVINLLDYSDRCFGFKASRQVFNIQVWFTAVIGGIMLLSRHANIKNFPTDSITALVDAAKDKNINELINAIFQIPYKQLFPDIGQVLLPFCWLILFSIVFIPALIKILPAFSKPGNYLKLIPYLREYLPDGNWREGLWGFSDNPSSEEEKFIVDEVAPRFVENSFWPNGDNTAKVTFFIAIYIFFSLIFPLKFGNVAASEFFIFYFGLASLSAIITAVIFIGIRYYLYFVSPSLVKK